jgi:DNA polymerase-3 subunit beta
MNVTTNAQDARDALRTLKTFVGRGMHLPATKIAQLTANADGGTVTLRRWNFTDATANFSATGLIECGTVRVDAEALATAIGKAKGFVHFVTEGERLTVTTDAGTSSVAIESDPNAELPVAYAGHYFPLVTVLPGEREHVRTVAGAAASGSDARAVLASVAIRANGDGSGEAVATDTYRMHVARLSRVEGAADLTVILPADVIATATKVATNFVTIEANGTDYYRASFLVEKGTKKATRITYFTVAGKCIEGPYPNYRSLIPDADSAEARWSVADAAGTANVLAAFGNKENTPALLTPSGSAVAVSATFRDGTKRDAIAPMNPDGDTIGLDEAIAFNPSYFAAALRHAGDGSTVRLRDGLKSAIVEGEHAYALVMPMRVQ